MSWRTIILLVHNPTSFILGIQPHSDVGLLTLSVQDVVGLQVMKDGEWIDEAPMEGSIVVNVADLLEIDTYCNCLLIVDLKSGHYKSPGSLLAL